jgi:predicted secreted protein
LSKKNCFLSDQATQMGWFTAIVLYVLIWWTVLFAVLPLGTKPSVDPDAATGWRGAPEHPRLGRKLLLTTFISAVVWSACALVITSDWLSFRHGFLALPYD